MRHAALAAGLGLLLTLGACAANHASDTGIAPSRLAAEKPLKDSQYYAPSETDQSPNATPAKEADVVPAAYVAPDTTPNQPAVEHVAVDNSNQAAHVKPLVPAFPANQEQDRLRDMHTVFFYFDKSELTPEAKAVLNTDAAWMKANPTVRVRVEGHCDERGTNEYNLALGSRRALQVRDYLVSQGVPAAMLEPISYGEEMPLKLGHDEAAWRMNRRVQFSPADTPRPASAMVTPQGDPKM